MALKPNQITKEDFSCVNNCGIASVMGIIFFVKSILPQHDTWSGVKSGMYPNLVERAYSSQKKNEQQ